MAFVTVPRPSSMSVKGHGKYQALFDAIAETADTGLAIEVDMSHMTLANLRSRLSQAMLTRGLRGHVHDQQSESRVLAWAEREKT